MEEKIYWIALNLLGISSAKFKILFEKFKSIKEIFNLSVNQLVELGISKNVAEKIIKWDQLPLNEEINYIKNEGIKLLTIDDPEYPVLLKEIYDPPFLLYVKGNIEVSSNFISIVGTRTPSLYGLKMAEKFASGLAEYGFIVVSGLARGIDTSVHIGTLKVDGKTVGVLGSGFKNFYPPENKKLEKEIIKNGAIITEFPSNTLPERYNFPKRNRIISGLSLATVVIEAGPRSGALITANFALEQGRDVFALPGRVDTLYSKGTNKLLKEGAILIEDIGDILEVLNVEVKNKEKKINGIETEEMEILAILNEPLQLEEILAKTKIQQDLLFQILTKLQIKGFIEELPGKIYRKKRSF
ncbi:MAG: DNA-processing protein DprA [Candidatus Omnitrophica bacterium]|nr:DNA-processing protein DprA [Candidatus Omnitrophota bacterium]